MAVFDIDGKSFDTEKDAVPAMIKKVLALVQALPYGKLLSTERVCAEVHCCKGYLQTHGRHPALQPYKAMYRVEGHMNVWGNEETIKDFKEETGG